MRTGLRWLFPGGLVFLCACGIRVLAPGAAFVQSAQGYSWVAVAVAFLLATLFHRSRGAVLALVLAAATWAHTQPGFTPAASVVALSALAALTAGLSLTRDRGITAPGGVAQMMAAGTLGALALGISVSPPAGFAEVVAARHLPTALTTWSGLPDGPLVIVAMGLALSAYGAVRRRGPMERGLFWALVLGMVALHPNTGPDTRQIFLLAATVTLALSAVETSYAMAYRDELTGLAARRALLRDLDAMGGPYAAAMVDVDHFKKFNDRHGHDVGDQVLRMVAGRLDRTGGGGRAYRYGGEEFTLLFPGSTREDVLPHLESVRAAVEHTSFAVRGWKRPRNKPDGPRTSRETTTRKLSVTVSIGVADSTGKGVQPEAVLKKADQALYRAKRAGRNQVTK